MASKKTPWYVNVLLGPIPAIYEKATGRSAVAKKDESADEYINTQLPLLAEYNGSKAAFDTFKSQQGDACAAFVKSKGIMVSQNQAREVCMAKINNAYSDISMAMEEEAYVEEQQVKSEFLSGDSTIYIIAIIAIIIILILKYY